jgi:rubrerythrin
MKLSQSERNVNRKSTQQAKDRLREMLVGMDEFPPDRVGGPEELMDEFVATIEASEPVGSVPEPARREQNDASLVLADKLGERLAFERAGVRLYESLLAKLRADGGFDGGPSAEDLEEIRDDERKHMELVHDVIVKTGGDPTAVTPAADVTAVISCGIPKTIGDARTSLLQSLEAIHVAEMSDAACWATLVKLTRALGHMEEAERFELAAAQEEDHVERVREWIQNGLGEEMGTDLATAGEPEEEEDAA